MRKTLEFPSCMFYDNETPEDQNKICKMFSSFFKCVYSEDNNSLHIYPEPDHLDCINNI